MSSSGRKWPAMLAALAVPLCAGCDGRADQGEGAQRSAEEGPSTSAVIEGLSIVVIEDGPPRLTRLPDGQPGTGAFDLEGAVGTYGGGSDAVREALERLEFKRGYARTWANIDPVESMLLTVFEFGADGSAADWVQSAVSAPTFDVPGVPDARGIAAKGPTSEPDSYRTLVVFAKGRIAVTVLWDVKDGTEKRAEIQGIAQRQYQRLP